MNVNQYIVDWLFKYGHFENPAFPNALNVTQADVDSGKLTTDDLVVKEAVQSIQQLDINMEALSHFVHGRAAIADGDVGQATMSLLALPRCQVPDYQVEADDPQYAGGTGSWPIPGCDPQHKDTHSVRVNLDTSRCPRKVLDYLPECIENVERISADVGIHVRHILDGNPRDAEHDVRWEPIAGGVIGYAYFPRPGTCNQTVNARLDTGYQPDAHMFSTLMIHEYAGHSFRLEHTRGGIMNPSILRTELSWRNDPSFRTLQRYFGGEPIDRDPDNPDPDPPGTGLTLRGKLDVIQDGQKIGTFDIDETDGEGGGPTDPDPGLPPFPV